MSGLVFAEKDPTVVLAEALAIYKQQTVSATNPQGVTLAPADPRRLHLQALLLLVSQLRQLIDYSGKQNLLRYVDSGKTIDLADFIKALAELWGEVPIPAAPSTCTVRFGFATSAPRTIFTGVRVTDGTNTWKVSSATPGNTDHIDAAVECLVAGSQTNGIVPGQISTLVDRDLVPGCTGVSNTTETISGRDIETTENFRARLRTVPESRSTCGPRIAYEQQALAISSSVADVVALGADDAEDMAGTAPKAGEVHVLIIEGTRDADGNLTDVVPDPSTGLVSAVGNGLSAEDVRPLTDRVIVKAPVFVDYTLAATYYIAKSRKDFIAAIQADVEAAFEAYHLWQSAIGRDLNPDELIKRFLVAGAKRVSFGALFIFTALKRDQATRCTYPILTYGGVEDD